MTTENNKHLHTTDKVKKLLREETGKHTEEGLVTASVGAPSESEVTQGLEVTLGKLMGSLARKRTAAGRPDALQVSVYCGTPLIMQDSCGIYM